MSVNNINPMDKEQDQNSVTPTEVPELTSTVVNKTTTSVKPSAESAPDSVENTSTGKTANENPTAIEVPSTSKESNVIEEMKAEMERLRALVMKQAEDGNGQGKPKNEDWKALRDQIQPFKGDKETQATFDAWKSAVKYVVKQKPKLVHSPSEVMTRSLEGYAREWFITETANISDLEDKTVDDFIEIIEKQFVFGRTTANWKQLQNWQIYDRDSAWAFQRAVSSWVPDCLSKEGAVWTFRQGCTPTLEAHFEMCPPKDLDEAVRWVASHPTPQRHQGIKRERKDEEKSSKNKKMTKRCSFCKKMGHNAEMCYIKNPALRNKKNGSQ